MADNYYHVLSENIDVFPCSKDRSEVRKQSSNQLLEQNIANIVTQLVDRESFIVRYDSASLTKENTLSGDLWFSIAGRLFRIQSGTAIPYKGNEVYAGIFLDDNNEIHGQDYKNVELDVFYYQGLNISTSKPGEGKWLQLFDKNGNLVIENLAKFNSSSLKIDKIDGKHE